MLLITKLRIGALVIAAFLLVGGCNRVRHPGLVLAKIQPVSTPGSAELSIPVLVTAKSNRVSGLVRIILGGGITAYVLIPWCREQMRGR
jgi:hypothetical protein